MNMVSPKEFARIKKKAKTLDRLNKILTVCLVIASVNLILLFFGIDLIKWGMTAATEAIGRWGPVVESAFYELSEILLERASS